MRQEVSIAVILIVLLVLLINPWQVWMPSVASMIIVVALLVSFAVFGIFVWRERPRDERETLHQLKAGRFAFLAGALILAFGVVAESLRHDLDPLLPIALGFMILAKAAGIVYSKLRH